MASGQINIEELKSRGLSCSKLKAMESDSRNDAKRFREVGFNSIANVEENIAKRIKSLRRRVCLLK